MKKKRFPEAKKALRALADHIHKTRARLNPLTEEELATAKRLAVEEWERRQQAAQAGAEISKPAAVLSPGTGCNQPRSTKSAEADGGSKEGRSVQTLESSMPTLEELTTSKLIRPEVIPLDLPAPKAEEKKPRGKK
ncbi:MAG TPA: hypothetical protein P5186_18205 [Candidatus Paceibacterota bacterium]|nr:hypothetical protein [Verrucomicrobiota bacterium]HRY49988.1 hypothetical protein [Candidatus Paceibacterota bacterium]